MTVFYNSNILHCAVYNHLAQRATLHGCMGDARGGAIRARNILQHGLAWASEPSFGEVLENCVGGRAPVMRQRLLQMANHSNDTHKYSLRG